MLYEKHAKLKKQQDEAMELWEQATQELDMLKSSK